MGPRLPPGQPGDQCRFDGAGRHLRSEWLQGETDSLLLGAGLTAQLTGGVAVSGRYAAELRRGFQAQMVNLGLRFDF